MLFVMLIKIRIDFINLNRIFFKYFFFANIFPIFYLSLCSDSGIFNFFLNPFVFLSPLFFSDSAMFYDKSHNIISDINFFVAFFVQLISLSVILYFFDLFFHRVFCFINIVYFFYNWIRHVFNT